jgi:formylglycine-generating enzyme required for sulfatase activity
MQQPKLSLKDQFAQRNAAVAEARKKVQSSKFSFKLPGLKLPSISPVLVVPLIIIGIILFLKLRNSDIEGMANIPAGCFQMGASPSESASRPSEAPKHQVCLDGFKMDISEVTQAEYKKVTGTNPSHFDTCPNCPVEMVSWNEAKTFCEKIKKRLPTEAEWEYAARAGSTELFSWGPLMDDNQAWYSANSKGTTQPVKTCPANKFGLYDMSGNAWEWVNDWADIKYYSNSPKDNPTGPVDGLDKIVRGGSYNAFPYNLRMAARGWGSPNEKQSYFGFRCAK